MYVLLQVKEVLVEHKPVIPYKHQTDLEKLASLDRRLYDIQHQLRLLREEFIKIMCEKDKEGR